MTEPNAFYRILTVYMRVGNLKLRDLAPQIGISPATLSRIMNGKGMDLRTFLLLTKWLFNQD